MFGWLEKRSGKLHLYQQRWVVRDKHELKFYVKKSQAEVPGVKPKAVIDLRQLAHLFNLQGTATPTPPESTGAPSSGALSVPPSPGKELDKDKAEFVLEIKKQGFQLRAPSAAERSAWMQELSVWLFAKDGQVPISRITFAALQRAIEHLKTNAVAIEGVFRVPGGKTVVDECCRAMYIHGDKFVENLPKAASIHEVATAFKQVLRNLPEFIFPKKLVEDYIKSSTMTKADLAESFKLRPKQSLILVKNLFELCEALIMNSEVNKMSARNLAVCLGPSLVGTEILITNSVAFFEVFEMVLSCHKELFAEYAAVAPEPEPSRSTISLGKLRKTESDALNFTDLDSGEPVDLSLSKSFGHGSTGSSEDIAESRDDLEALLDGDQEPEVISRTSERVMKDLYSSREFLEIHFLSKVYEVLLAAETALESETKEEPVSKPVMLGSTGATFGASRRMRKVTDKLDKVEVEVKDEKTLKIQALEEELKREKAKCRLLASRVVQIESAGAGTRAIRFEDENSTLMEDEEKS